MKGTKVMSKIFKTRSRQKGVTVECAGVGFDARGGSKSRVGRYVCRGELGNRTGRRDMKNRDANETGDRTLVSLRGTGWETSRDGE